VFDYLELAVHSRKRSPEQSKKYTADPGDHWDFFLVQHLMVLRSWLLPGLNSANRLEQPSWSCWRWRWRGRSARGRAGRPCTTVPTPTHTQRSRWSIQPATS